MPSTRYPVSAFVRGAAVLALAGLLVAGCDSDDGKDGARSSASATPAATTTAADPYADSAKSDLRNVAVLEETWFTDHGSYTRRVVANCQSTATQLCYQQSAHVGLVEVGFVRPSGLREDGGTNAKTGYCLIATTEAGVKYTYNSLLGGVGQPCSTTSAEPSPTPVPTPPSDPNGQALFDLRAVAVAEEYFYTDHGFYTIRVDSTCGSSSSDAVCYVKSKGTAALSTTFVTKAGAPSTRKADAVNGYCITVRSTTGRVRYYNSVRGGLRPKGSTSC